MSGLFLVRAQARGVAATLRACPAGSEPLMADHPGTWVAIYAGARLALWLELPAGLGATQGLDDAFESDLLVSAAWEALSRSWWRLAFRGWSRWDGKWSLSFAGQRVPRPLPTSPTVPEAALQTTATGADGAR